MAFVTNERQQIRLDDTTFSLTQRGRRFLKKSWAEYFSQVRGGLQHAIKCRAIRIAAAIDLNCSTTHTGSQSTPSDIRFGFGRERQIERTAEQEQPQQFQTAVQ